MLLVHTPDHHSPTALPTLLMEASATKCCGQKGVANSPAMQAVKTREVTKRMRCGGVYQDKGVC